MTTRRQFIKSAVAVAVATSLPGAMADATSQFIIAAPISAANGLNIGPGASVTWEGGGGFVSCLQGYTEAERIAARINAMLANDVIEFSKFYDDGDLD